MVESRISSIPLNSGPVLLIKSVIKNKRATRKPDRPERGIMLDEVKRIVI